MKLEENFRIIFAIAAKDIFDAIKNKMVQGIMIGVAFLMLSSQALSFLLGLKNEPTIHIWDQNKSAIVRKIVRSRELNIHAKSELSDLQETVSQSAAPVLGIVIPADFDELVDRRETIRLQSYRSHWTKPDVVGEVASFFEENLSRLTQTAIEIDIDENPLYPPAEGSGYPMMIALGVVMGVMTIGLILTPYLIADERETHTLDALIISPARITHLLVGKSIAGLFYSLTASLIIFLFSWRWVVHSEIMFLAVFLGGLCAVSIGLLVGALVENPTTVNMISGLMIGGLIMPTYFWTSMAPKLPPFVKQIFEILPSIAMYKIVRQSSTEIFSGNIIVINVAILVVWSFVMLGLVSWRIRLMDR